jgi:dipeptidase
MKVKTLVELKYDHAYTGWKALTFNDSDGNEVCITMTDDQYVALSKTLNDKAERIRKERADEAAEQQRALEAKENEDD